MKTLTEAVKACGGVWPSKAEFGLGIGWNGIGDTSDREPDFIQLGINGPEYTRPEFEAEAARLSGKPGWSEAPQWAQWLGQSSHGHWEWYESKPKLHDDHWNHSPYRGVLACYGTSLGDWRDTLERRPEVMVAEPDTRYDWVPTFGWHGECIQGPLSKWKECVILDKGQIACKVRPNGTEWTIDLVTNDYNFRPLKSDRERWVEAAEAITMGEPSKKELLKIIYDALKSGELPMPEKD